MEASRSRFASSRADRSSLTVYPARQRSVSPPRRLVDISGLFCHDASVAQGVLRPSKSAPVWADVHRTPLRLGRTVRRRWGRANPKTSICEPRAWQEPLETRDRLPTYLTYPRLFRDSWVSLSS